VKALILAKDVPGRHHARRLLPMALGHLSYSRGKASPIFKAKRELRDCRSAPNGEHYATKVSHGQVVG
jgi:hypothetical protein